jgi:hypothetical protein
MEWKPPKVRYTTMINKIEDGALKLQDLESESKSIKLSWIKKLANKKDKAPCKNIVAKHFTSDIENVVRANL